MSGDSIGELKVKVAFDFDKTEVKREQAEAANETKTVWQDAIDTIERQDKAATQAAATELARRNQMVLGATDAEIRAEWRTVQEAEKAAKATTDAQKKASEDAAKASAAAQKKAADESKENWKSVGETIRNMVLVAAGAVAALGAGLVNHAAQTDRAARSLGLTVTEYQRLEYAAAAAGVETNDMLGAVGQLQQKAADAAAGGGSRDLFRELGISATDASGNIRSANDLMLEAADAMQRMGPGSRQTGAAMQLFGDAGRKLIPTLARGREGMQGLFDEFDALGGGVTEDAARKSREMEHSLLQLKIAFISAAQPIVETVLPALRSIAEKLQPIIGNTHNLKVALSALGLALLGVAGFALAMNASMLPIYAIVGLVAAALAALVLIVDDLIVTFEGGDSVTRRFIDDLFGFGATTAIVESVKGAFDDLGEAIESVGEFFAEVGADISSTWNEIWESIPEPLRNILEQGAQLYVDAVTAPFRAVGDALGSLVPQQGAIDAGAAIDANAILGNALAIAPAATEGATPTVTATPGQAARAEATTRTARGGGGARVVNGNQRVDVRINGLVDPNQLPSLVRPIVDDAVRQANEDALNNLSDAEDDE